MKGKQFVLEGETNPLTPQVGMMLGGATTLCPPGTLKF